MQAFRSILLWLTLVTARKVPSFFSILTSAAAEHTGHTDNSSIRLLFITRNFSSASRSLFDVDCDVYELKDLWILYRTRIQYSTFYTKQT